MAWLAIVSSGFWFFSAKFFIPVSRPEGSAHPTEVIGKSIAPEGRITVYNFWNPTCPCSRFMEGHVKDVIRKFEAKRVQFVHVVEGSKELPTDVRSRWRTSGEPKIVLDADGAIARKHGVWAAPAAVVVDTQGKVQFVGSYNITRYCDDEKTAFAEQAIEKLVAGKEIRVKTVPFYGCTNLGR